MIKLTLPPKPVELTKEKQDELTGKFKANPKAEDCYTITDYDFWKMCIFGNAIRGRR